MNTRSRTVLWIVVLVVVAGVMPLFAQYRGAPNRLGGAFGTPNGVLVYRPAPFDVKIGYDFTAGNEYIFLSGDLRLIDNRAIVGVLHGTFGIGLYGKLYPAIDSGDEIDFDWGSRIPVGLSVMLLNNFLEIFVEVAPGIEFYPRLQLSDQPIQIFAGATVELDW